MRTGTRSCGRPRHRRGGTELQAHTCAALGDCCRARAAADSCVKDSSSMARVSRTRAPHGGAKHDTGDRPAGRGVGTGLDGCEAAAALRMSRADVVARAAAIPTPIAVVASRTADWFRIGRTHAAAISGVSSAGGGGLWGCKRTRCGDPVPRYLAVLQLECFSIRWMGCFRVLRGPRMPVTTVTRADIDTCNELAQIT